MTRRVRRIGLGLLALLLGVGAWLAGSAGGRQVAAEFFGDPPSGDPPPPAVEPDASRAGRPSDALAVPGRAAARDAADGRRATAGVLVVEVEGDEDSLADPAFRVGIRLAGGEERLAPLDASRVARFEGLPAGDGTARAVRPGFAFFGSVRCDGDGSSAAHATLVVRRGDTIRGTVVAEVDGRPIAGATVDVADGGRIGNTGSGGGLASYGPVTTGADGAFETPIVPHGQIVTVRAVAPGFGRRGRSLRLTADAAPRDVVVLRLPPGGSVRGVVVDPTGGPVRGAFVLAVTDADLGFDSADGVISATTGEAGRFELLGVPYGVGYRVHAAAPPLVETVPTAVVSVGPAAPTLDGLTLTLRRAATVTVHVRDSAGGPVAQGRVELQQGPSVAQYESTGSDGVARLQRVAPGSWRLDVYGDGYVPARDRVDIVEGASLERVVVLDRGVTLAGQVVDTDGRPVANARLFASRVGEQETVVARGASDAEGRFVLGGLSAGPHVVVADGPAVDPGEPVPADAPAAALRVVVRRRVEVRARLVLAGVPPPRHVQVGTQSDTYGRTVRTEAWEDGERRWLLPPGHHRVSVRVVGFAFVEREIVVEGSAPIDLGELPLVRGVPLTGRVVDVAGAPVPDAEIEVLGPDLADAGTSDEDGRFRIDDLRPLVQHLRVAADGFLDAAMDAAPGSAPVRVELRRGALVTVTLRNGAPGAAPRELSATSEADGSDEQRERFTEGSASLRRPAGATQLRIFEGDREVWARRVELVEGKDVSIDVDLSAAAAGK